MAKDREITIKVKLDGNNAVKGSAKVKQSIKGIDDQAGKASKSVKGFSGRLSSMSTVITGVAAAALGTALYNGFRRAISKGQEFDAKLADIEAITGITGDRLDRLGERSLELSKKYGTAASEIVEANKLVASQLAEKIDFQTEEGFQELQKISEQAVILQKAAGIDLASAVDTTTSIINQFNLAADESGRVINTLAAGAKYGAAEVPDIGRALVNAGAAAAGANQSIESTNAAIQVLAANGQRGERAGTALRAIFTRLKTESQALADAGIKNVNVESEGLVATLRKMKPLLNDTTEAKKIFGEEALNQIQILIRNADAVESLTGKVTDTKVAHEQAETRMSTFEGASDRLATTIDRELISAFQEANGAGVKFINMLSSGAEATGAFFRTVNRWVDRTARADAIQGSDKGILSYMFFGLGDELFGQGEEKQLLSQMIQETESTIFKVQTLGNKVRNARAELENLSDDDFRVEIYQGMIKEGEQELKNLESQLKTSVDALELQRDAAKNAGGEYGVFNETLREYRERLSAVQSALQSMSDAEADANENAYPEGDPAAETSNLVEQLKKQEAALDSIINKEGDWTAADSNRARAIQARIDRLEKLQKIRAIIAQGGPTVAPLETDDSPIEAPELKLEGQDQDYDPYVEQLTQRMMKEQEFYQLQQELALQRQTLKQAESEAVQQTARANIAALEREMAVRQQMAAIFRQAVNAQITSLDDLKNHVINTVKDAIKARVAEAVSIQLTKALASVPFPFNVAAAAAAGATISGLFDAVLPDFARGGVLRGPSHARGGIPVMSGGRQVAEAEGDEAFINKRSTRIFYDELSAINEAGGGRRFPGASRKVRLPASFEMDGPLRTNLSEQYANRAIGSSSVVDELRSALESANLVAPVQIRRFDEDLQEDRRVERLIGNKVD